LFSFASRDLLFGGYDVNIGKTVELPHHVTAGGIKLRQNGRHVTV